MQKRMAIVGAGGHFGSVIFNALHAGLPQVAFALLGRKRHMHFDRDRCQFIPFDFRKNAPLPEMDSVELLLDLSGPCKRDDGILQQLCSEKGIGYMDIAVHNSHYQVAKRIAARGGFHLVHTGLFPGLSNLMADWVLRHTTKNQVAMVSTFPAYAGGGRHVAETLGDVLAEAYQQGYIKNGERVNAPLFSESRVEMFFGKKRRFYRWELPEIQCLENNRSPNVAERWVSIDPAFLNPLFGLQVKLYKAPKLAGMVTQMVKPAMTLVKSKLLKNVEPPFAMTCYAIDDPSVRVNLQTKKAVALHGRVILEMVRKLLDSSMPPGFHTPEDYFKLEEILQPGNHSEYHLEVLPEKGMK